MREILFRGKRIDNGEWVKGQLVFTLDGWALIVNSVEALGCGYCIEEFESLGNCRVDPDTVGQYTGLTDKNGKKIFEGDIISTDLERPYLMVEYRDACFMFNCNDGGKDYYDIFMPILDKPHTEYKWGEVIGTVHDNPELLKGGEG